MTKTQLSKYLNFMSILEHVDDGDAASVDRDLRFLQRWGLIQWARRQGNWHRIYHITELGRKFLRDLFVIETEDLFSEFHGFTSVATMLDTLNENGLAKYINERRAFLNKMISNLRKLQYSLNNKEKAREILLQYHIYRALGELRWLQGFRGTQGMYDEQS